MTKTLADMTPEQRASCGGMWAETSDGLAIIIEPFYTDKDRALDTTVVFSLKPKVGILQRIAAYVTPRFDLPRAWNPDGTPVKGGWVEAEYIGDSHGMRDVYYFDGTPPTDTSKPNGRTCPMIRTTPEEAAQRRDHLIDLGYLVETPALRAYKTIAGMTYEYAVQVRIQENGHWHQVTEWNPDPNPYKPGHAPKHNERLVRRLVSQPEEVKP